MSPSWTQQGMVPVHSSRFSGVGESFRLSAESSLKPLALSLGAAGVAAAGAAVLAQLCW